MDIKLLNEYLSKSFNNQFEIKEKRHNLYQILLPLFYPDGDMLDIFISEVAKDQFLVSDCGITLMRLSYNFDLDTDNKIELFKRILLQQNADFDESTGSIQLISSLEQLFNTIMQLSQTIAQVSNLKILQRKTVASLFYDDVKKYIESYLSSFNVKNNYMPVNNDQDLVVDYAFIGEKRSVYVFPVKGSSKTQSAIITILRLQQQLDLPFTSVLIHDDFESLTKAERRISMKVADKQFGDFNSFKESAENFINRALA